MPRWPLLSRLPLTLRGLGALVLAAACGMLAQRFGIAELAYVGALLAAAVVVSAATLYLLPSSARVTRAFSPDVAAAGSEVRVRLTVEIRSSLPTSEARWRDAVPDGVVAASTAGAAPDGVLPPTGSAIAGPSQVEVDYAVRAERRGLRRVGPLALVTTDPFGFTRRRRTVGDTSPLVIVPEIVDLDELHDLPGDAGGSTRSVTDRMGQGADNLIPRTYAPGDSMRRIHWRASAHRDELMVRQEEQETTPEAVVLLDRGAGAKGVAFVLTGLTVANVVGVPFGTFLGQRFGWRIAFLVVALIFALAAVMIALTVPAHAGDPGRTLRAELRALRIGQVWLTLGVGAVGFGGFFAAYSYVASIVTDVAGAPAAVVPVILIVMGIGMTIGNLVGGHLADRDLKRTMLAGLGALIVVQALLALTAGALIALGLFIFLVGFVSSVLSPSIQTRLMDVAGDNQSIAAALNHSALNIGNATGAFLGGVVIAAGS
uniref:MFS transporter n=1 Tax=Microbacterium sp. B24 TaxID=95616 RepID=UPI001EF9E0F1